jgi:hypothetical protein
MNRLSLKIAFVLTCALLAGPFIVLANAQSSDEQNLAAADTNATTIEHLLPVATGKPINLIGGMWKTAPGNSRAISTTSAYTDAPAALGTILPPATAEKTDTTE